MRAIDVSVLFSKTIFTHAVFCLHAVPAVPSNGNCKTGFADSMGLQIILCSHGL